AEAVDHHWPNAVRPDVGRLDSVKAETTITCATIHGMRSRLCENMTTDLVVGLDLGGTKTAAGFVTSQGALLSHARLPTPKQGVKRDLAALFDAAHATVGPAEVTWREICAIGVGVPGAFDPQSQTVWAPNLPGWSKVALKRLMESALLRPTFVE